MLLPGSGRIFSGSRIRTSLGKWDSPKSPQGYCRAVADPDFQIIGGGGGGGQNGNFFRPFGPQFGLNITGAPPWIRHWLGKKTVFRKKMTEVRDTGCREKGAGMRAEDTYPPPFWPWDTSPVSFPQLWQTKAISHSPTSTTTKTTNFILRFNL